MIVCETTLYIHFCWHHFSKIIILLQIPRNYKKVIQFFASLTGVVVVVVLNVFLASISALLDLPFLALTIGVGSGSDSVGSGP
jgi:hypothetical protein